MKKPLVIKFAVMAGLMLLLLIPISMIDTMIRDRMQLRANVLQDIARSSSRNQTITGPILVLPYRKKVMVWVKPNAESPKEYVEQEKAGYLYFLPKLYRANANIRTEIRKRGIYEALLFHAKTELTGHFEIPARYGIKSNFKDYTFGNTFLSMGINDIRGIENTVQLTLNNKRFNFYPGAKVNRIGEGIHAPITARVFSTPDIASPKTIEFSIKLLLQGTNRITFTPIGSETFVHIESDWAHPSFNGDYLPTEHGITNEGFTARWRATYFSTNFKQIFNDCLNKNICTKYSSKNFGVSFIDPVDQYVKSDRAIKYALLFIVLTFAGFFLFEILKQLKVHPVQYGLVGLALALFYLLLLSLSEHIGFLLAYVVSATACIALIGFYISHALKSTVRAIGFSCGLGTLYATLFGLLSSEDYALLMGAALLFLLLGLFMTLTRKLDWYNVGTLKEHSLPKPNTEKVGALLDP